jgi:hypothetical protein
MQAITQAMAAQPPLFGFAQVPPLHALGLA